ncbi:uncharacterized protein [Malus domestica]|uniref:uncharacterized protein isoform X2 n=1 Tax=Malus domestica TaxID=3750 RepID=UPI00397541D6
MFSFIPWLWLSSPALYGTVSTLFGLQSVATSTSRPTLSFPFFLFACRSYPAQFWRHWFQLLGKELCWDYPAMSLITLASCLRQFIYTGPRSSSEGFSFVLLQSSFHILFINIFGDIVRPFFSWRIVPSNIWKRCHCCSLVCPFRIFKAVVGGALRCICIFVPFIAFEANGYNNLCLGHLPSDMRPWCKARVPSLYNYIQSHYWGVGFLRYFQVKRLPNFLLASPILSLALCSIVHYAKSKPEKFFSLGFRAPPEDKDSGAVLFSLAEYSSRSQENCTRKQVNKDGPALLPEEHKVSAKQGYLSVAVLPCILHLGFMAATAFFVMHVQVATRLLSFSPPLY